MIVIKRPWLAVIILVAIFGGIALSNALGYWKTQNTKNPARIKTGEFAGKADPGDIRGSYTFLDIEKAFEIPASLLCEAFSSSIAEIKPDDKVNVLETLYAEKITSKELGTDSVRLFVALVKQIPYTPEAGTGLPPNALHYLLQNNFLDSTKAAAYQITELEVQKAAPKQETTTGQTGIKPATDNTGKAIATTEEHTALDKTVTGNTTFADVLSWGLTQEEIEAVIGFAITQKSAVIKDAVTSQGKSFGTIKAALQTLINKKNK